MSIIESAEKIATTNPYVVIGKWVLLAVLVLGGLGWFSHVRYVAGQNEVQGRWDHDKLEQAQAREKAQQIAQREADATAARLTSLSQQLQDALHDQATHKPTITVLPSSMCKPAPVRAGGTSEGSTSGPVDVAGDASAEVPGLGEALKEDADHYPECQSRLHTLIQACIAKGCNK